MGGEEVVTGESARPRDRGDPKPTYRIWAVERVGRECGRVRARACGPACALGASPTKDGQLSAVGLQALGTRPRCNRWSGFAGALTSDPRRAAPGKISAPERPRSRPGVTISSLPA